MPFPTYLATTKELVKRPVLVCVLLEWATRTITRDIERVIEGAIRSWEDNYEGSYKGNCDSYGSCLVL